MTKPGARLIVEPCRVRDAPRCISTDWAMWYMYHPSKDSKMLWSQLWIEENCQAKKIIYAPFPDYGPGLGFVNSGQTLAPASKFFLLPPRVPVTTVCAMPHSNRKSLVPLSFSRLLRTSASAITKQDQRRKFVFQV